MSALIPPSDFAELSQDERNAWFVEAMHAYDKRQPAENATIRATPFEWVDPSKIPPRRWIYGRHYIRQFVTETVAPGAYGKSTLAITEALSIVTGRPLLGVAPDERVNVWVWNGEDPREELQRRFAAACLHHVIDPSEIEGRLFVDTGRETKIILAEMTARGAKIAQPVVDQVIRTIKKTRSGC
jgi:RecA-family ATPase